MAARRIRRKVCRVISANDGSLLVLGGGRLLLVGVALVGGLLLVIGG